MKIANSCCHCERSEAISFTSPGDCFVAGAPRNDVKAYFHTKVKVKMQNDREKFKNGFRG